MTEYSDNAQRLLELLSEDDIQQIRKDNPFRKERNAKICDLWLRGVSQVVLAEVSGLSSNSIRKIRAVHAEEG